MSEPEVSKTSESNVTRWCPPDVAWMSELGWDELNQIPTKLWLVIRTFLDQFMDVRLEFWHPLNVMWMSDMSCEHQILTKLGLFGLMPLDVLGTSCMSCRCQNLTSYGHAKIWLKYDFPVDIRNVSGKSDSDQTWPLWADIPWMWIWWRQWQYIMPNLTSMGRPSDVQNYVSSNG